MAIGANTTAGHVLAQKSVRPVAVVKSNGDLAAIVRRTADRTWWGLRKRVVGADDSMKRLSARNEAW